MDSAVSTESTCRSSIPKTMTGMRGLSLGRCERSEHLCQRCDNCVSEQVRQPLKLRCGSLWGVCNAYS